MPFDALLAEATAAYAIYKKTTGAERATFLRAIATAIDELGDQLLQTASTESNLPLARLTGERGRTQGQLRLFADLVENGYWAEATIDTALPDRQPLPRPDMRRLLLPLGPVAVFGASNFPLAFSTAGGDTASALAAGCPVVYKAHPAHPRTSVLVAEAIAKAAQQCNLPAAVFQHVVGGTQVGTELVQHPAVRAVAFTGSYGAGKALFDLATRRDVPIPVYAEMGSVNPLFILPEKLASDPTGLAQQAAQSVLLGAGQFCTCPGLVFVPADEAAEAFVDSLGETLSSATATHMLHAGIADNYYQNLSSLLQHANVHALVQPETHTLEGRAGLARTSAAQWIQNAALQEEVFGPFTLVVTYQDEAELLAAANALHGQLTCTLWGTAAELAQAEPVADALREKCGRLLFAGVPTGVEVSHAMTHGGPFPATTDPRSTSVGSYAIKRFARPVTFQSAPAELLPPELRNENPTGIWRMIDGEVTQRSL
ncbi:aldehyde dehydrogenase (NADP(+)) [Hymenobacter sp. GOD-10R]|uniref:aldehyde dehydrogenase (NADP(+)) n=1 Tax=Hymenobacter sp. GOD-10R TaxID=3093922 RepID=UPI002D7824C3|nr:aldehyde dehydrogenase (NADP(+)) [Hymenobacter sp. GOD-10R]WRQ29119.1 aldehyde dehydrogenase (NADP(+)) [Hymenobacter sp. GOD-10R]